MCDLIKNVVLNYGILPSQIYTITTDNGANMVRAVQLLGEEKEYQVLENVESETSDDEDSNETERIIIQVMSDSVKDSDSNENLDEETILVKLSCTSEMDNDFIKNSPLKIINMRCAAHTLQLAIEDSIKDKDLVNESTVINKSRKLVKKLRTQTLLYVIKSENLKKPTLDCTTRWHSTLDMLINLHELRDFCKEFAKRDNNFKKIVLNDSEWVVVKQIIDSLMPSKICVKTLQEEQLTIGDFFGAWLSCKRKTSKIDTDLARKLTENMNIREKNLFENDVFVSAIFLDPRYKVLLSRAQTTQAISHLEQLWLKIHKICGNPEEQHNSTDLTNSINEMLVESDDEIGSFLCEKETASFREATPFSIRDIFTILSEYDKQQNRICHKLNIIQFWESQKQKSSQLYELAKILHSVPATQVSVERLFSGLKFILSPLRTNIKGQLLEQQMLVRNYRMYSI